MQSLVADLGVALTNFATQDSCRRLSRPTRLAVAFDRARRASFGLVTK
jgi:hypothetical protein